MKEKSEKLKALVEELDLTSYELAVLVSDVFADCYGSHNYELFKETIKYKLRQSTQLR